MFGPFGCHMNALCTVLLNRTVCDSGSVSIQQKSGSTSHDEKVNSVKSSM